MAGVVINKRMLELERENARLQGEIGILEKEKLSLTEKLKRVEAQLEILQKSMVKQQYTVFLFNFHLVVEK